MIKLLVVDDEKGITEALTDYFQNRGFSVRSANSGEEAVEMVKAGKPDIIFLDIRMKAMSGLEALKNIKEIDPKIKVIMLTIHEEKEIVDRARELGADEYVTKPFRVDYLDEIVIKKVQELMKERR
jgi:two-component system response regulator (stage 0 sporulation protein F)